MRTGNAVVDKSRDFAIRVIRLCKYLMKEKREFVISKQLLRCGTSVGANVREAVRGQSKRDFAAKMGISLKECAETEYWLDLLHATEYIADDQFTSINTDCQELMRLLTSIVKTMKKSKNEG